MATFAKGDVVIVPFPFSVGTGEKNRPAVVVAPLAFAANTDYLLALITAQNVPDPNIIVLDVTDIDNGALNRQSYVRPTYLFTVIEARIHLKVGTLRTEKMTQVVQNIIAAIT